MLYEIEIDNTNKNKEGFFTTLHIETPSIHQEHNDNMTTPNSVLTEMFRLTKN